MDTMRAARMVELGKMICEPAPVRAPMEGEVLVKNELAAICGSDLHVVFQGLFKQPHPLPHGYPGHEGLGQVVESRHSGLNPGDWVLTCPEGLGGRTFADYQTLPGAQCLALPPFAGKREELLMAQQLGTTIFALRQNPVDVVGKTVLVMGQGSAGVFFAYNLKRAGAAHVIVSDLSEARLSASKGFGADLAVRAAGDNVKQAVMDLTGGRGVHFLVDAVGSSAAILQSVDFMRLDGEMLWFGLPETKQPIPFNFHDFHAKRLKAYSTYGTQQEPDRVSFKLALDLIARREIDVSKMVSHRLPIERIDEAMHIANDRSNNALKVTVTF